MKLIHSKIIRKRRGVNTLDKPDSCRYIELCESGLTSEYLLAKQELNALGDKLMRTEKINRITLDRDDSLQLDLDETLVDIYWDDDLRFPDQPDRKGGWAVNFGSPGQLFTLIRTDEEPIEGKEINNPLVIF